MFNDDSASLRTTGSTPLRRRRARRRRFVPDGKAKTGFALGENVRARTFDRAMARGGGETNCRGSGRGRPGHRRGTGSGQFPRGRSHHQSATETRHVEFHSMRRRVGRMELRVDSLDRCFGRPAALASRNPARTHRVRHFAPGQDLPAKPGRSAASSGCAAKSHLRTAERLARRDAQTIPAKQRVGGGSARTGRSWPGLGFGHASRLREGATSFPGELSWIRGLASGQIESILRGNMHRELNRLKRGLQAEILIVTIVGFAIAGDKSAGVNPGDVKNKTEVKEVDLRGRIVCLPEAMHELYQTDLPPNHEHIYGFKTSNGTFYTLLRAKLSEALFVDEQVRKKELLLRGHVLPKSQIFEMTGMKSVRNGVVYDLFYYCDVCAIKTLSQGPCMCCQGPVKLVEQPLP